MSAVVGILGTGAALPASRVALEQIQRAWANQPLSVVERLGVRERAVVEPDVDAITLAAEAGERALRGIDPPSVDALLLGTQTSPYLTRSGAAIVAEMLGLRADVFVTDVQFSDKSGTAAALLAVGWIRGGLGRRVLAIGADTLGQHAAPGDPFEYTAAAGAGAWLLGDEPGAATVEAVASNAGDTPDRFRLDGERHLRTGGAVMAGLALERHVRPAFAALGVAPEDVDQLVTAQPDAAAPKRIARALGVAPAALEAGLVAADVGDAGAAAPLLGAARVLDRTTEGERLVVVAHGAGGGADALLLRTTGVPLDSGYAAAVARRMPVDYPTAVRYERRYAGHERLVGSFE
jgi:hydroxymethylglutaryl-CoA synthase